VCEMRQTKRLLTRRSSNQQLREDRLGSMAKSACSGLGVRRMLTTAVEGSSVTALAGVSCFSIDSMKLTCTAWEHAPAARALAEAEVSHKLSQIADSRPPTCSS
jgi:hypothetical protein